MEQLCQPSPHFPEIVTFSKETVLEDLTTVHNLEAFNKPNYKKLAREGDANRDTFLNLTTNDFVFEVNRYESASNTQQGISFNLINRTNNPIIINRFVFNYEHVSGRHNYFKVLYTDNEVDLRTNATLPSIKPEAGIWKNVPFHIEKCSRLSSGAVFNVTCKFEDEHKTGVTHFVLLPEVKYTVIILLDHYIRYITTCDAHSQNADLLYKSGPSIQSRLDSYAHEFTLFSDVRYYAGEMHYKTYTPRRIFKSLPATKFKRDVQFLFNN